MAKILVLSILLFSSAVIASLSSTSISISNPSEQEVELWLNGAHYVLSANSGVSIPCLPDEQHSLQTVQDSQLVECGAYLELRP